MSTKNVYKDFKDLPRKTEYWREAIKGNYSQVSSFNKDIATQAILKKNDTLPLTSSQSTESSKQTPRKIMRTIARTDFGCNGELIPWNAKIVVHWKGKEIHYLEDISSCLCVEVQFELYELNWRAEFLALDIKVTHLKDSPINHVVQRREIIAQLWSNNDSGVILFPGPDENNMNKWSDKCPDITKNREAVTNLHLIMEAWPNFPEELKGIMLLSMNSIQLQMITKELLLFYTKMFHAHYFQLPILPCSLCPE